MGLVPTKVLVKQQLTYDKLIALQNIEFAPNFTQQVFNQLQFNSSLIRLYHQQFFPNWEASINFFILSRLYIVFLDNLSYFALYQVTAYSIDHYTQTFFDTTVNSLHNAPYLNLSYSRNPLIYQSSIYLLRYHNHKYKAECKITTIEALSFISMRMILAFVLVSNDITVSKSVNKMQWPLIQQFTMDCNPLTDFKFERIQINCPQLKIGFSLTDQTDQQQGSNRVLSQDISILAKLKPNKVTHISAFQNGMKLQFEIKKTRIRQRQLLYKLINKFATPKILYQKKYEYLWIS